MSDGPQVAIKEDVEGTGRPFLRFWKLILIAGVLAIVVNLYKPTPPASPPPSSLAPAPQVSTSSPSDAVAAAQFNRAFSGVFKKTLPCVVKVVSGRSPAETLPRGASGDGGVGSGIIIRKDGVILTNSHVVEGCRRLMVVLSDGRALRATLIGSDPYTDVAALRVTARGLPEARLGDSDRVAVGEWVLCIGNPFNLNHTLTVGVVGGKGRSDLDVAEYEDFIQTDAVFGPGVSGGALVNLRGEVIGMSTVSRDRGEAYRGVGFAIPINLAIRVAEDLIATGRVARGDAGLSFQDMDERLMQALGLEGMSGILVTDVAHGGPADRAGVLPYDEIFSLQGRRVKEASWFRSRIATARPGQEVALGIVRDGERLFVRLTVGQLSRSETTGHLAAVDRFGLGVEELSRAMARSMGYEESHGILVTKVAPGSAAARAGFQWGDLILEIDRKPLRNQKDYGQAVERAAGRDPILFRIRRGEAWIILTTQML